MAQLKYEPIPKEDKEAALAAIEAYKKQNPTKYEMKKKALLARYGLAAEPEEKKDASDIELEEIKKKVKKTK